jgi:hypothetical protein
MNVKDLIDKVYYDGNNPLLFVINNRKYGFYEVVNNKNLLQIEVNKIKIESQLHMLSSDDAVIVNKDDIIGENLDVLLPANSHYYMIVITIT